MCLIYACYTASTEEPYLPCLSTSLLQASTKYIKYKITTFIDPEESIQEIKVCLSVLMSHLYDTHVSLSIIYLES